MPTEAEARYPGALSGRLTRTVVTVAGLLLASGLSLLLFGIFSGSTPGPAPMPQHPFVVQSHPIKTSTSAPAVTPAAAPSTAKLGPNELSIPSIGATAPLFPEVIDNFSLEIPGDVKHVGVWTGGGQIDGSTGTVLLAGHINWYDQGNGALYDLADIRPGALIYVSDSAGRVTTWSAVSLQAYPKSDLPQGIFAPTGPRRLALVTCGGAFDPSSGHYADNVVVTAAPVTPPAATVSS